MLTIAVDREHARGFYFDGYRWGRRGLPINQWIVGATKGLPASFLAGYSDGYSVWDSRRECVVCGDSIETELMAEAHQQLFHTWTQEGGDSMKFETPEPGPVDPDAEPKAPEGDEEAKPEEDAAAPAGE